MAAPMYSGANLLFLEVSGVFFGLSIYILTVINNEQPEPYMDEIFHIPQAQSYCEGNFTKWDPMITTLPGLYLVSVGLLKPLAVLFKFHNLEFCTPFWLRSINVLFAVGNLYVIWCILWKLHYQTSKDFSTNRALLAAINLTLFPVLYFFTFLYYTDAGSVFFALLLYLLSLHGNHAAAAAVGACAVAMRQTNIVWAAFACGCAVTARVTAYAQCGSTMERDDGRQLSEREYVDLLRAAMRRVLADPKRGVAGIARQVAAVAWPYAILAAGFVAFVAYNGSLVVGDRSSHRASFHVPQLFYLCAFSTVFAFPFTVGRRTAAHFVRCLRRRPCLALGLAAAMLPAVHWLTYVHPYLLADNRHYPFYVWRKVFERHALVRYLLVGAYVFALWSCYVRLCSRTPPWKLVFAACCSLATVPQSLLEFRYFILPYLMFRLHMRTFSPWKLSMELAFYVAVNVATLRLFLEKPFAWPDVSVKQRFMW
ncbi:PREDICTED: putative Dol-P-Glc:Glc(2)Man(9)GlcNAc(2)-PP-Dol alpha-1,2-glucosyltransferase [Priapulus caudatus]|uniref:Dol-P-Glc:Glc(2)Man(9)GlcNAc(2)-PP-Dol alpha-1,2-glucosyltransferase n=1 Tax=Priapulus caudatus TaxID=37621 RepID=A0ABM1F2Q2_PRICU|nr:PREDICTED: putative Dol-P-Glc:Glc(2)Man(9)GlcNAc(2)-PP-Dol alpha-1,2-glucosyltransferase [Priapulus caudatus]